MTQVPTPQVVLKPEEARFKDNVTVLCQLVQKCQGQLKAAGRTDLPEMQLAIAVAFLGAMEPRPLHEAFITHSYKTKGETWNAVKEESSQYFIKNADALFGSLPIQSANILKDVFESSVVAAEEIAKIWVCLRNMTKLCIKFISRERMTNPGFMSQVDLVTHAKTWGIDLKPYALV